MRCCNKKSLLFRDASSPSPFWGRIGGGLLFILFLFGCEGGDDYRYPSVLTDYACLLTDEEGQPEHLLLDDGSEYPIVLTDNYREAHTTLPSYRPDTLYRVISIYELGADDKAHIYSLSSMFSQVPTSLRQGETLKQDSVYLQSTWFSGGYLNMVIELKALNSQHRVGFVDTTPKDMQGKEFTLYHDACDDVESYRQKLYASIPLAPFASDLQRGDVLRFVVNLYEKGLTVVEYPM